MQSEAWGFDALIGSTRDWEATFEDFPAEPTEFIDGGDQVVVILQEHGTPTGGGVELSETYYMLYTLRDGKIVRLAWFSNRKDAFAAACLAE